MTPAALLSLMDRLVAVLAPLRELLAMLWRPTAVWGVSVPRLPMPIVDAINRRLDRAVRTVRALAEQIGNGALRTRRSPVRAADAAPRRKPAAPPAARVLLPTKFDWLNTLLLWHATRNCVAIRTFLEDPEMQAFIAMSPRIGEALRPMCRMLGLLPSLLGPAGSRRKRAAQAVAVSPAAVSPVDAAPPEPPARKQRVRKPTKRELWPSPARCGVSLSGKQPGRTLDEVVRRGPPRGSSFRRPL